MWSLSTPALTEHVFKAPKPNNAEYAKLDAQGEVLKMMPMKSFFLSDQKKRQNTNKR
jgi:maltose/moltooligosaccharide transporter